jgi:hypothetical protein
MVLVAKQEKYVIMKGGLYANVDRKFGGKPKVYTTLREAQYDNTHYAALRAGVIAPYTGTEVARTPGVAATTKPRSGPVPPPRPARAAAGMATSAKTVKPRVSGPPPGTTRLAPPLPSGRLVPLGRAAAAAPVAKPADKPADKGKTRKTKTVKVTATKRTTSK